MKWSQAIKYTGASIALLLMLWCSTPAIAQQYQARTLDGQSVDGITGQERWRFGRKPDWGTVHRHGRGIAGTSGIRTGRAGNGSTTSGSNFGSGGSRGAGQPGYYQQDDEENGYYYSDGSNGSNNGGAYREVNPSGSNPPPNGGNVTNTPPPPAQNYTPPNFDAPDLDVPTPSAGSEGFSSTLMWILIVLGGGVLLFMVIKSLGKGAFTGKKKKVKKEKSDFVDFDEEDEEEEIEDITAVEFVDEITLAVRQGNFRKAVRLRFLNILKELAMKGMINWKINKTNIDYYYELASKPDLKSPFMDVTTVYEYVWYGEYKVGADEYEALDKTFNRFNEELARA